ncbi:MAG: ABC transporter ATP-binding protein [Thermoplasmata archaeon]|nr:MAG: ABC transporter ATP-binding protein [Thermoplasmata archaeon]
MDNVIQLDNVTKIYKSGDIEVTALRNVNLRIKRGGFVAIQGPSGSGKTTLLNIIGCIDTATRGKVLLDGQDVSKLKDRELTSLRLHKLGFIFQQFYLIPTLNAAENVELPLKEAKMGKRPRTDRVMELMEIVQLGDRYKHYPNQLSGGEQQRVAIARALANEPDILLADEPTGEIDSATSTRIIKLMRNLNTSQNLTVIIVTHDPTVAQMTDRVISIRDGRIAR